MGVDLLQILVVDIGGRQQRDVGRHRCGLRIAEVGTVLSQLGPVRVGNRDGHPDGGHLRPAGTNPSRS
jgi:hypothetical protein